MKYCPYCGEALPEAEVQFCPECGKALSDEKDSHRSSGKNKRKGRKRSGKPKRQKKITAEENALPDSEGQKTEDDVPEDDGYDGYYDDVLPLDNGRGREGIDKSLVKKILLLAGGVILIIGGCVAMLYLL